jgi:hypothetical protein
VALMFVVVTRIRDQYSRCRYRRQPFGSVVNMCSQCETDFLGGTFLLHFISVAQDGATAKKNASEMATRES